MAWRACTRAGAHSLAPPRARGGRRRDGCIRAVDPASAVRTERQRGDAHEAAPVAALISDPIGVCEALRDGTLDEYGRELIERAGGELAVSTRGNDSFGKKSADGAVP